MIIIIIKGSIKQLILDYVEKRYYSTQVKVWSIKFSCWQNVTHWCHTDQFSKF